MEHASSIRAGLSLFPEFQDALGSTQSWLPPLGAPSPEGREVGWDRLCPLEQTHVGAVAQDAGVWPGLGCHLTSITSQRKAVRPFLVQFSKTQGPKLKDTLVWDKHCDSSFICVLSPAPCCPAPGTKTGGAWMETLIPGLPGLCPWSPALPAFWLSGPLPIRS